MSIRAIGVLFVLFSLSTFGQVDNRWVLYFVDNDGGSCYYDSETLQRNENGSVTVWIKIEYAKPIYEKDLNKYKTKVVMSYLIECKERKIGLFDIVVYFSDGTNVSDSDEYTNTEVIFPDTMGETLYKQLCK